MKLTDRDRKTGRRPPGWLLIPALVLAAVSATGALWETASEARDRALYPAPGQMVDVGGRRLHLWCEGSGSGPTVVMLAGGGIAAVASYGLQNKIAAFARVCSYDRAGLGWSDPASGSMSLAEQTTDFERILGSGRVSGKVILAPESFGALIAIDYAEKHPDRVAGVVFIDAAEPRTWFDAMRQESPWRLRTKDALMQAGCRLGVVRLLLPRLEPAWVASLPGPLLAQFREVFSRPNPGWSDALNAYERTAPVQRPSSRAGSLGAIPIVVIRHGKASGFVAPAFEAIWPEAQARLAGLTTGRTITIVAENGGHEIAQEEPDLVAAQVRTLTKTVATAQDPAPYTHPPSRGGLTMSMITPATRAQATRIVH